MTNPHELYGDFSRKDWREGYGIDPDAVPRALILQGELTAESLELLEVWAELLGPGVTRPLWNTVLGRHNEVPVGYANVVGGPMTAMTAHPYCVMGTELLIQTGYFGGLSHDVRYGDILIVSETETSCGTSADYGDRGQRVPADAALVEAAVGYCERQGWPYVVGSVRSTDAISLETAEMVEGWAAAGHLGVDMETSTTFALAHRLGRRAIALLNLSDHVRSGDHLMNYSDARTATEATVDARIRDLALHLTSLP